MTSPLLTPKDVEQTKFHTHRFHKGYDTDEVDAFMDTVADTIKRLISQLQAYRTDIEKYKAITGQTTFKHDF